MKIIDKYLDNYYSKKLEKYIYSELLEWFIDNKFIYNDNHIQLLIKLPEYNDKQYQEILTFYKEEAIIHLCNQNELKKILKERIKNYFDMIKGR